MFYEDSRRLNERSLNIHMSRVNFDKQYTDDHIVVFWQVPYFDTYVALTTLGLQTRPDAQSQLAAVCFSLALQMDPCFPTGLQKTSFGWNGSRQQQVVDGQELNRNAQLVMLHGDVYK